MTAGARRYADRRATGTRDRAVALPLAPEANDEAAYRAEAFVGRRYGLRPSRSRRPDVGDFVLPAEPPRRTRAVVIDVKWTPRDDGRLVSFLDARVKADVYILVVGTDELRVAGWTWGHAHRRRVADLGHGPRNVTAQSELRTNLDVLMGSFGRPCVTSS